MQIINPARVYPVVIIGSGASGGMAAWNLTRQGIDVVVLDAGQKFDRSRYWTHVRPWEARERRAHGEEAPGVFFDTPAQPVFTPPAGTGPMSGPGRKESGGRTVKRRRSSSSTPASSRISRPPTGSST